MSAVNAFVTLQLVKRLRTEGVKPRVHGNGFIQLDLVPGGVVRLHVWHQELPRQAVDTGIHDHRFNFESLVLKGSMLSICYEAKPHPDGVYNVYRAVASTGEDTALVPMQQRVNAVVSNVTRCNAGETYSLAPGYLHRSEPINGSCSTLMWKGTTATITPRVLCPVGLTPDAAFNRHAFDESMLWQFIEWELM